MSIPGYLDWHIPLVLMTPALMVGASAPLTAILRRGPILCRCLTLPSFLVLGLLALRPEIPGQLAPPATHFFIMGLGIPCALCVALAFFAIAQVRRHGIPADSTADQQGLMPPLKPVKWSLAMASLFALPILPIPLATWLFATSTLQGSRAPIRFIEGTFILMGCGVVLLYPGMMSVLVCLAAMLWYAARTAVWTVRLVLLANTIGPLSHVIVVLAHQS